MSGYIGAFDASACSRFLFAAALVFFLALTHLDAKSVIVDDAETDKIIYSPNGWHVGNLCIGCHFGDTQDSTIPVFFTFTFTGTSVEVKYSKYFSMNVSYSIDNVQGTAMGLPFTSGDNHNENQTLFREEGLANVQHTLRVEIPKYIIFQSIIYDDGSVVPSSVSSVPPTSQSTNPTDDQPITSVSSRSSPKIGAIIGGVVAGVVVGIALIWYLRRRSQHTSQRDRGQLLSPRSDPNGNAPLPGAQTQDLPGSHYYAPSGIASSSSPTSRAFAPLPSPSAQTGTYAPVTEPNPSGAVHSNHAPFITPFATNKPDDIHSDPGVHVGMPPPYTQSPAVGGPPSSSYTVAVNRIPGQIPNEPVEEGLMSREAGIQKEGPSAP